jgi:hypothetical protein
MGTWGTGLYADDTTSDVRDAWLKKLRLGVPGETATAEMLKDWGGADAEPLFWLALADTQWTWGRLEAHVHKRAQEVLAAGVDLERWEGSKDRSARARVLAALGARLKKKPPPPKPVRVTGDAVAWKRGQLWAYRTLDGKYAAFRIGAFDPTCGMVGAPVTELLDVATDDLPSAAAIAQAELRRARSGYDADGRFGGLAPEHRESPVFGPKVKRLGELPRHRLKRLAGKSEPRPATAETMFIGVPWDSMDQFLANMFDIGAPRLGAVHRWALVDGTAAYTVVEWMEWPKTLPEPQWYLGVLDHSGEADGPTIATANVVCSIIVYGFLPGNAPHEVGYRPRPPGVVETISGAVHKWESLPKLLTQPNKLKAGADAMKAFSAAVAARRPKK